MSELTCTPHIQSISRDDMKARTRPPRRIRPMLGHPTPPMSPSYETLATCHSTPLRICTSSPLPAPLRRSRASSDNGGQRIRLRQKSESVHRDIVPCGDKEEMVVRLALLRSREESARPRRPSRFGANPVLSRKRHLFEARDQDCRPWVGGALRWSLVPMTSCSESETPVDGPTVGAPGAACPPNKGRGTENSGGRVARSAECHPSPHPREGASPDGSIPPEGANPRCTFPCRTAPKEEEEAGDGSDNYDSE